MAPRQSSPCKLLIIVLHANREHRRDAYATLGSATCLTPGPPTVHVVRHSTKLLSLTLSLVDFLEFLLADRPGDTSRSALKSVLEMSKLQRHVVPGYDRCCPYGTRLQTFRNSI